MKKLILALMGIVVFFALQSCSKDDDSGQTKDNYYAEFKVQSFSDESTLKDFYHFIMEYTIKEGTKDAVTKTIDLTNGEKLNVKVNAPLAISYKLNYVKVGVGEPVIDNTSKIKYDYSITINVKKNDNEVIRSMVDSDAPSFSEIKDFAGLVEYLNERLLSHKLSISASGEIVIQ